MAKRLINLPNILTGIRVLLMPLVALFIVQGQGVAACVIYVIAGFTDVLDGYLARQWKQETAVGKLLDPIADKILLCVAMLYLLAAGAPPFGPTIATLLLAREFFITGLRAMAAAEGLVISAGQAGKVKALLQNTGLAFLLGSLDFPGQPFALIGTVLLWISAALSYWSMWLYLRDAYHALKNKLAL